MLSYFEPLIETVLRRPYVFGFLIAYLVLAWRYFGPRRTFLWLVTGYAIAWLSEVSSIHNGFPYGSYKYVYASMGGELMVAGVPFFDSLSYPFLCFAAYSTAQYILKKRSFADNPGIRSVLLGALLTMLLDVIIDPIATMGDKWFLGQIHYYVYPGWYFGVPMTNFAGWFLVSFAIIGSNVFLWKTFDKKETSTPGLLYPLFYISIALFNIAITFWVSEFRLGVASSLVLFVIALHIWKRPTQRVSDQ